MNCSQLKFNKMPEKPVLYFAPHSRPCRAVLIGIRVLNIDIEIKNINLSAREQHTEEFKKINPDSKIPVFVDTDGFIVCESRAILAYLVNSRKPGDDLYSSDPRKRALIDQILYYDATVIYPVIRNIWRPVIYQGATTVDQSTIKETIAVVKMLECFLADSEYFAGDKMTIADISILATITTISEYKFDFTEYPKLSTWYEKMQLIQGFEENRAGAKFIADSVVKKLGKYPF